MSKTKPVTEMQEGTEPAVVVPQQLGNRLNTDSDLLDKVFARVTRTGKDALKDSPLISCRTLTFTVDGSICEPEIFVDDEGEYYDFSLTMRGLDASEELRALEGVRSAATVAMDCSQAMLYKMNGSLISPKKREFLWHALGMRGRSLCLMAYQQLGSPSAAALGKYQASFTIG